MMMIADAFRLKEDYVAALNWMDRGIDFAKSVPENREMLMAMCNEYYGKIYTDLNNFEKASQYLNNFERFFANEPNLDDSQKNDYLNSAHFLLGLLAVKEKRFDDAIKEYEISLAFHNSIHENNSPTQIPYQINIANVLFLKGEYEDALKYLQNSIRILYPNISSEGFYQNPVIEQIINSEDLLEILNQKSIISKNWFLKESNPNILNLSLSTFQLTDKLVDKMLASYKTPKSQNFLQEKSKKLYEEAIDFVLYLYETTSDDQYLNLAFYYMEKSKSALLLAGVNSSSSKLFAGIENNLTEEEHRLKKEISLYEKLIFEQEIMEKPDSIKLGFWYNTVIGLKHSYDSLMTVIQTRHPEYYKLQYDLSIAKVSDIQNKLDKHSTLVEYMLGDSSLYTISISKNEVFCHREKITPAFSNALSSFRNALYQYHPGRKEESDTKNTFESFSENARQLYQYLLEPILSKAPTQNLVIIPDGQIGYIPFEVLVNDTPEPGNYNYRALPYLFLDHTIRYEYSSTLFSRNYPKNNPKRLYAGFGPEYEGDELLASRSSQDSQLVFQLYEQSARAGLARLQYNQPEIEEIAATTGGEAFTGSEALESTFKKTAPNSRILHLAMHSMTNDLEPLYSQLVFSKEPDTLEDGLLHAYELYNMQLNADLAVLSACNTGAGKLQKGEGIMSLSRAFKYAGCPNIVMSLWKADDLSTKQIMTNFFNNLMDGKGKNVALQEARKTYLFEQADDAMTHPYYWATFVLIGDDEGVKMGNRNWWLWGTIGSIGLFFLIGWIRKTRMSQKKVSSSL